MVDITDVKRSFNTLLEGLISNEYGSAINIYIDEYIEEAVIPAVFIDYINELPSETNFNKDVLIQIRVASLSEDWVLNNKLCAFILNSLGINDNYIKNYPVYDYTDVYNPFVSLKTMNLKSDNAIKDISSTSVLPNALINELEITITY